MDWRERAIQKIMRLQQENQELNGYVMNIEREYMHLTEDYMEDCIRYIIGKEQNKLKSLAYRHKKKIDKNNAEIHRLMLKYNLQAQ